MCLPGSKKAVAENLDILFQVLGHILDLISDSKSSISSFHASMQQSGHSNTAPVKKQQTEHVCPHKTGAPAQKKVGERNTFSLSNILNLILIKQIIKSDRSVQVLATILIYDVLVLFIIF